MGYNVTPVLVVLCICGASLSAYAVYIERAKYEDSNYKALCDVDETISCTRVLTSPYSRGIGGVLGYIFGEDSVFNIPNSYIGLVFFSILLVLSFSSSEIITGFCLLVTFASVIASAYLLYILIFVMHMICPVCIPIHVINFLTFIVFTIKWTTGMGTEAGAGGSKKKE